MEQKIEQRPSEVIYHLPEETITAALTKTEQQRALPELKHQHSADAVYTVAQQSNHPRKNIAKELITLVDIEAKLEEAQQASAANRIKRAILKYGKKNGLRHFLAQSSLEKDRTALEEQLKQYQLKKEKLSQTFSEEIKTLEATQETERKNLKKELEEKVQDATSRKAWGELANLGQSAESAEKDLDAKQQVIKQSLLAKHQEKTEQLESDFLPLSKQLTQLQFDKVAKRTGVSKRVEPIQNLTAQLHQQEEIRANLFSKQIDIEHSLSGHLHQQYQAYQQQAYRHGLFEKNWTSYFQEFLERIVAGKGLVQKGQGITRSVRYDLYSAFFNQWLKQKVRHLSAECKRTLGRDNDEALVNDFKRLARYLALSMYAKGIITVEFNEPKQPSLEFQVWLNVLTQNEAEAEMEYLSLVSKIEESERSQPKFDQVTVMSQAQARANLLQDLLPLTCSGAGHHFVHKSLYEYLIVDSMMHLSQDNAFETSALKLFKQRLIQTEPGVLSFLKELSPQSKVPAHPAFTELCNTLFALIQRSAQDPDLAQASSNAATILNCCEVQLTYQQWAGVQLPGADLSYCVLAHSDLRNVNLQGANLSHCMFYQTNMENANLCEVRWGEFPRLQIGGNEIAHHPKKPWLAIMQTSKIIITDRDSEAVIGQLQVIGKLQGNAEYTSITFSPDGRHLASGDRDGTIYLWDIQTLKPVEKMTMHNVLYVSSLAFSPDGLQLASEYGMGTIHLWDMQTLKPVGEVMKGDLDKVTSLAFSPDGRRLASGGDCYGIRLWDMQSQKTVKERCVSASSLAFSPDGARLASASGKNLYLWDSQTLELVGDKLQGHTSEVTSLAFSPDGTLLASGSLDCTVRLWDMQTLKPIGEAICGHKEIVTSIAFSPDGTCLASGSNEENEVRLWDTQTQKIERNVLRASYVRSIVFSPNGACVASGNSDGIQLWDVQSLKPFGDVMQGHTNTSLALSPDDTASESEDNDELQGHKKSVTSLAFNPDGTRIVSGSDDHTVRLWDRQNQKAIGEAMQGHKKPVISVAFSPDGTRVVSGSDDCTVLLWDTQNQKAVGEAMQGHKKSVISVAFSPDGTRIASGSNDHTIRLWTTQNQTLLGKMKGHTSPVKSLVFSPDGARLLSVSWDWMEEDNSVRFWNMQTLKPLGEVMQEQVGRFTSVSFSPDATCMVSVSYLEGKTTVRLWNITETAINSKGIILLTWNSPISSLSFAPRPSEKTHDGLAEEKTSCISGQSRSRFAGDEEDRLVMSDSSGVISFWAISRTPNPQIRCLGMPTPVRDSLLLVDTQLAGCQMDAMSRRLLEQYGVDISQVVVQEATPTLAMPPQLLSPPESKVSPGNAGLFASKTTPASSSSNVKSLNPK